VTAPNGRRRRRWFAPAILLPVVVGVTVLIVSGGWSEVTDADRAKRLLTETGALGPAAFIGLFVFLHSVGIPIAPLVVAGGAVWPKAGALAMSWLGSMAAAFMAFGIARVAGRDWVEKRLPERFRRYDQRLAERGFLTVLLVRVFLFLPPPLDWLSGVSRIRVREFGAATALGIVPSVVFLVFAGDDGARVIRDYPLVVLGVLAIAVTVFVAVRRRRARVTVSD
jgi:phospholipase D1/2